MKKLLVYLNMAFLLLSGLVSCTRSSDLDLTGEWHMVSSGETDMETVDVYISFAEGEFSLFQKKGDGRYRYYDGSYIVNGSHVSGTYGDGTAWGSSYDVRLEDGGDVLVMTASNGSSEVSVYNRSAIPDEVRTEAVPATRSECHGDFEPIL